MGVILSPLDTNVQLETVIQRGVTTQDAKSAADYRKVRCPRIPRWIISCCDDMAGLRVNIQNTTEVWRFVLKCGVMNATRNPVIKQLRERNVTQARGVSSINEMATTKTSSGYNFSTPESLVQSVGTIHCFDRHRDIIDTVAKEMKIEFSDMASLLAIIALATASPLSQDGVVPDFYHDLAVLEDQAFRAYLVNALAAP